MWFPCGCCKPELTKKERKRLLIQNIRKAITKGQLLKLKTLFGGIQEYEFDANVQVPMDGHWTRFIQIAVTKTLMNHSTRLRYLGIVKFLLENGADFNMKDEWGHCCVDDIDKCPQLIRTFMQYGYDGQFTDLIDGMFVDEEEEKEKKKKKGKKNKVQPIEEPLLEAEPAEPVHVEPAEVTQQ